MQLHDITILHVTFSFFVPLCKLKAHTGSNQDSPNSWYLPLPPLLGQPIESPHLLLSDSPIDD